MAKAENVIIVEGYLNSKPVKPYGRRNSIVRRVPKDLPKHLFNGYKLDELVINASLQNQEDIKNLIDFLTVSRFCFADANVPPATSDKPSR
jgi:hypothetical protein